jgi:TrmH family RNA methyltransferase
MCLLQNQAVREVQEARDDFRGLDSMSAATLANLAVVLVETRNPLNIGAVARAMSNFGFTDLRLVSPYDEAFREAVSAVGAGYILQQAKIFSGLGEAVGDCSLVVGTAGIEAREPELPGLRLERGGRLLRRHLSSARAALVFGSEKFGLSNADLSHCRMLVRIPTRPEHESMNLGQAVAVALYELIRQPGVARRMPQAAELADGDALERITLLFKEMMSLSGEFHFEEQKSAEVKLRQLVRRTGLREPDAPVWTGILRQVIWRLKNPG